MRAQNPPELADGGYWYVVPIVPDPELGGQTPGDIPGQGWAAFYGTTKAAIRTPEPIAGIDSGGDAATVIAEAVAAGSLPAGTDKPHGRVRGS